MQPGNEDHPILRVVRDFEGRSFATRRVIAMQRGQPILNMAASFQLPEEGLPPGRDAGRAAARDAQDGGRTPRRDGRRIPEKYRRHFLRARAIEIRPVSTQLVYPDPQEPRQDSWFRIVAPIGDDPALHRAILAYASDMSLLGTSTLAHGVNWMTHNLQTASLDHALWLHEPFRADEWLLYSCDSPWAGHACGFNRGRIYARDGWLVASVAQEGLIQLRD